MIGDMSEQLTALIHENLKPFHLNMIFHISEHFLLSKSTLLSKLEENALDLWCGSKDAAESYNELLRLECVLFDDKMEP